MTSFIIAGRDKQKRIEYAKNFCTKQQIDHFDISLVEKDTTLKQNVSSIGIDEIKRIQKTVFLKPLKSNFKAVIVEDAHLLTTEAQNAFLKILEEPPEHTLILLGVDSKEALLPTILSRCQVITLENETIKLSAKEQKDIAEFIEALPTMPIGDKLKKAELLAKDKDKALLWLEKLISVLRDRMLETPDAQFFSNTIQNLQKLHTLLKTTNVNPRFAIENTLLHL